MLNLTITSTGLQYDRLGFIWLGDNEIWRTTTAEPKAKPGIVWTTWKEVTPFLSLWKTKQKLIFELDNVVNDMYTGYLNTTVTAIFIDDPSTGASAPPADQIVAVSARRSAAGQQSSWHYPTEKAELQVTLPRNIKRAVFSVAAAGQHDDEFWWQNAPDEAIPYLPSDYGFKGGFREVRVRIDGDVAGLAWPFPVVFTGGVAPGFHRPIAGPQAFDMLEQEIDITPWLGVLCDGKPHTFSIEVVGQSDATGVYDFWYLSGKIFLWLDESNSITTGDKPIVALPDNNYLPNVRQSSDNVTTWTQTVTRTIEVVGILHRNGKLIAPNWSQTFSMVNKGLVKDNYQACDAKYTGRDQSTVNGASIYSVRYNYPIYLDYNTSLAGPDFTSSTRATLDQTMERTVSDQTVYSNGLEPFLAQIPGLTGSAVNTKKHSTVFQYALKNGTSAYNSTADQTWTLSGLKNGASNAHPLLYKRDVSEKNQAYTSDKTYVYGGSAAASAGAIGLQASTADGSANEDGGHRSSVQGLSKQVAQGEFAFRPFHSFLNNIINDEGQSN